MKVTTEALDRCEVLLTIEVEPAEEQDMLKKAAKSIAREIRIPGFRPGKAPYNAVVRRFGIETVQQKAFETSGEKFIQDALKEADLKPVAQISLDSIEWNPLTLKIKVPGPPKVELSDYRDIRLEAETIEVTAEEVEKELKELQEQNAAWAPVERPAELNDLISMSVVEKDGDEVLAEHETVEYELVLPKADDKDESEAAESSQQPDLTTPLLGLSAGEEKTFTISYPENYDDNRYAGKDIIFTVNVSSVKEKELDPLDDDFAQSISEFDTLDELKEKVRSNLKERREFEYDQKLGQEVLEKIIEAAKSIEWSLATEEEMIDNELELFKKQFDQAGLSLDDYLKIENKSEADLREEMRENVVKNIERTLVLGELANIEKLSVSNSEILERAKFIADVFGSGSDQVWQRLISSDVEQNRLAYDLLMSKVILRLAEIAKGEAPELGAESEVSSPAGSAETDTPAATSDNDDDGSESETTEEPVATEA